MTHRLRAFIMLLIAALAAAGCGGASAGESKGSVKKIIVGTGTQFPKVAFIDENGKLTGFDVELVRELDARLPQYEFEFRTMNFSNILLSLETGKIDFGAHEFEKNPEREEKYLFNKVPYAYWRNFILVAKDNNDPIESLDDMHGKRFLATATSAQAQILENYNKEHPGALEIVYNNGGANDLVTQITTGRVDAAIGADFSLPLIDPQGKLKTVGKPLTEAEILFIFRKDEPASQQLADDIDAALLELRKDGTLAKLSQEWLGRDFTYED